MNYFIALVKKLRRLVRPRVILYLAPHQDDELLTMGIDICRMQRAGCRVHIALCTDGSKSNMRFRIMDGRECPYHDGVHSHELDIPQFVAARDREFAESCTALGCRKSDIHLSPLRAVDGELSAEQGEQIIEGLLASLPRRTEVRTISPHGSGKQHSDHTNLGLAAARLYEKGKIKALQFFVEPYCLEDCRKEHPELGPRKRLPDAETAERLKKAAAAYSTWSPEEGFYAIGYHSVADSFDEFLAAPEAYFCPEQTKER